MDEFLKALGSLIFLIASFWIKDMIDARKRKREEVARKQQEEMEAEKKRQKDGIVFSVEFYLRVQDAENKMMRMYGHCRMFVYHFYNGEFTIAKLPLLKICIRHEIVEGPYVPYMKEHFEGKPVPEMFHNIFKDVFDNGFHYLESKEEIKEVNRPLYNFMTMWDIGSMLFLDLCDSNGEAKAVIVMHWPRKKYRNDDEILKIRRDKNSIEKIYREL